MEKKRRFTPQKALIFSLLFTLIFTALSSGILHDWGNISISTVELETQGGNKIVARVYKPDSATAETPAPTVIFTHGLTVNKESYAQYGLELARRGFVVITPDMLNHGDSEITGAEVYLAPTEVNDAYGAYAAVRYAKTLNYVDQSQIGVAGHSAGGQAANNSVKMDNAEETPAISAIYLVSSDPVYTDTDGNWTNIYGARDFGIYYTLYDHVYFKGVDSNGQTMGVQEWLSSDSAKSLFAFGQDPSAFEGDQVIPGHTYFGEVDGEQVFRRVNAAAEIHPKPQGGSNALAAICDFFQDAFVAPNYIVGQSQHYAALTVCNILGLLGVLMCCVFSVGCLTRSKFFAGLREGQNAVLRPAPDKKGKVWFWILTILNCVFAFFSISAIFKLGYGYCCSTVFAQQTTNIYALWALLNGLFMLITSFASYALYARKNGATMSNWGLKISFVNLLKSILLAVIACAVVFVVVAIANNVFYVDYHYYLWGLKNIPLENLGVFFVYLPMYLIFGLAVSIALNSAYHCKIANEPEWVNDLFFAVMNTIPALVITFVGYYLYAKSGVKPFIFGSTYTYTYTINAIPVFPIAVILIRRLFKKCNNPYVPGIIAGILLCWLQVSCSFTLHANMFYGSAAAYLP
ncbi:alpha/beta hydrolase [Clostridium sp. Marseille-P299]|uniref:alpha/beta hydrolase n=1 Tax=Clostridium sp. Marseille-P299 TaxID=1805477 RepID=UPI000834E28C|nr:alpha/beta fold hydrolase [Clostridium sp. Marseille-P299]